MMNTFYIVAGGPSLINYDWGLLLGKRIIAVNRAFEVLPWAEIIYFTDHKFFDEFCHKGLLQARSSLVSISDKITHPRVIKYTDTGESGLELDPGGLRNGKNSGYAAINLAVHLGAQRIILMGFDMDYKECDVTSIGDQKQRSIMGRTHWHSGYPVKPRASTYQKMLPFFGTIVEPLDDLGIEVWNANLNSKIEVFRKVALERAHVIDLLGAG